MSEKVEKKRLAILKVLKAAGRPLPSSEICQELVAAGHEVSERTVRFYLRDTDGMGLTESLGRRGRRLTEAGIRELSSSAIMERVGFLSARIAQMTYKMTFDLEKRTGDLVVNVSVIAPRQLAKILDLVKKVFEEGYAMGRYLTLLSPGERIGDITVPEGAVGVGTVCSVTLNGVLLHHGIPVNSRFGGVLEVRDRVPMRFVEIINYDGTSVDPLEVFIHSGMTDYVGAVTRGTGRIGASFREFPAVSRDQVRELAGRLEKTGLGGFMLIGSASQPVLQVPVNEGMAGAIVIGGLNPMAIAVEKGLRFHSRALAGLIGFERLFPYTEIDGRLKKYL